MSAYSYQHSKPSSEPSLRDSVLLPVISHAIMKQTSRLLVSRWVFSRHGGQPSHPSPSSRVETAQKRWRSTFLTQKQRRITGFPRFSTSNDLSEQNLDRSQRNTDINSLKESFSSLEIAIPLPPDAIHDVKGTFLSVSPTLFSPHFDLSLSVSICVSVSG